MCIRDSLMTRSDQLVAPHGSAVRQPQLTRPQKEQLPLTFGPVLELEKELEWLRECLVLRIEEETQELPPQPIPAAPKPNLNGEHFSQFLIKHALTDSDRLLLILALAPTIAPEVLNQTLIDKEKRLFPQYRSFGGHIDRVFFNYIPTLQTFLHLCSGGDTAVRTQLLLAVDQRTVLKEQIIAFHQLSASTDPYNPLNQIIRVSSEYLRFLLGGQKPRPDFGQDFPATLATTELDWPDLVLNHDTLRQVTRLKKWLKHGEDLVAKGSGKFSASFPVLFYGPPGTGKTLTAMLLGKSFQRDVFRIDLSMVVSKYIGETEKNLARLFDRAQGKGWILFFDEADSLFGKRTQVNDAHDKWANLEVSYLLQRLETYPGLTILASNLKDNLDNALTRRFQAMIKFSRPGPSELEVLWQKAIPSHFTYANNLRFANYTQYKLTGANITNILKYACLEAMDDDSNIITHELLRLALKAELEKENRTA